MPYRVLILALTLFISGCNTIKTPYFSSENESWQSTQLPTNLELNHTFYFVGETGSTDIDKNNLKPLLKRELAEEDLNSTIVLLGSHLYPKGLAKEDKNRRTEEQRKLLSTLDLFENFKGNYFMIGGEHDWEYRGDKGLKAIERMEDFVEDEMDAKDFFLPENGCGDPTKVRINKEIDLLFLNTQWWLEDWGNEKDINEDCDVKSRTQFIDELQELVLKNKNDQLIVFMHHPLHSNGVHGGNIPAKYHLFPLTEIKPKAFLPLPIFGSLSALFRNFSGTKQDLANTKQQILKKELEGIFLEDMIMVSAHDESLQYFNDDDRHYIVSGSGGRNGYARKGGSAEFASAQQGFSKLFVYENGEIWVEFYGLNETNKLEILFRKKIVKGKAKVEEVIEAEELMEEWPDSITIAAGKLYKMKPFGEVWFGHTYRDAWITPVTAPVLNIADMPHEMIPVKKGGGQQTNSLRLKDSLGREFVLRSVMKSAYKETPIFLRNTWAQAIVQNQLSSGHPYGAFVIPPLAKAANIYHTEPSLVYVPKQKALGIYNETFGNELYLYEDRPDDDRSDVDGFGNSKEIIGFTDLRPELENDHDNVIDQEMVLRSRLFDIWVHDWDRHDDQWRWASFEEGDKTVFRPIPRDRDQVFFKFDGVFNFIVSTFPLRKFRSFKDHLTAPRHTSFNAQKFDRYFLNRMEKDDWLEQAEFLKTNLTDSVIENAIKIWPPEIYELNGEEVITKLKSRRDQLPLIAEKMYEWIGKTVNVIGTTDEDRFEVERLKKGKTIVRIYDLDKEGEKKDLYFERSFTRNVTKEIRLYGLADDDEFELIGKSRRGTKIRIIAGSGDDIVDDQSKIVGLRKMTKVYDVKDDIEISSNGEVQDKTSNRYDVNDYNRQEENYNNFVPLLNFGSNIDDGFFFGGGMSASLQGFRSYPYKAKHIVNFSTTFKNKSFTFKYDLDRKNTFYRIGFDYVFNTTLQRPIYVSYYGLGNETKKISTSDIMDDEARERFHYVRLHNYKVSTGMKKTWLRDRYTIEFGPVFQSSKVEVIDDRVSEANYIGLTETDKERKNFLGGYFKSTVKVIESTDTRTTDGVKINFTAAYYNQLRNKDNYGNLEGSINYYVSFFKKMQTTLAIRTGAAVNLGNAPFYRANNLGGNSNLRGYRQDRFSGKYMFYQNLDLRVKLFYWQNRFFPFELGIIGGFDYGRVWLPKESSNMIHKGYTAGLWVAPFQIININFNYSISKEDKLFSFGFGYFF